jgi:hypothetical protein
VIAQGHLNLEQYQEAEKYLSEAQDLVAKSNDWPQIQKVEKALIRVYRSTGRESEANEAERRLGTLQEVAE